MMKGQYGSAIHGARRRLTEVRNMKAIILVAGVSRRLFPLTEYRPKCLLEVGGKTIFDHQMDALLEVGIREVCLVVGYRREQIMDHARRRYPQVEFSFRINQHFFETNTGISLFAAAEEFLDRDFIYLNGDVLFEPELLRRVVDAPYTAALAVEVKRCGDEEVKVICDGDGRVRQIGKLIDQGQSLGEFIGVARFNATMNHGFYKALDDLARDPAARNDYFEAALAKMTETWPMHAVDVTDLPCIEIDFPEDYEAARTKVMARIKARA